MPAIISAAFVALVAAVVAWAVGLTYRIGVVRDLPRTTVVRLAAATAAALTIWLLTTALVARQGFFANVDAVPPRLILGVAPPLVAVAVLRLTALRDVVAAVPRGWFITIQSFRTIMELILWALLLHNLVPPQMTFEGANFDVLAGLNAPVVAWLVATDRLPRRVVIAWNLISLTLLANIVTIAIMSAPGPLRAFHTEPANTVVAGFPLIWLPTFLVPVAVFGHVMSLYQLSRIPKAAPAPQQ